MKLYKVSNDKYNLELYIVIHSLGHGKVSSG